MYRPILASGALLAAITLTQACRAAPSHFTPDMAFCPEHTRDGYLPPWEVAKAAALDSVISDMERHLGKSCWELLGRGKVPYIAGRLALQGGGQPQERAVRKILAKCRKKDWYPGKQPENVGGRPPVFSDHAKQEVARVAMEHKRSLVRPTPALCRARLPRKTINKRTGKEVLLSSLVYDNPDVQKLLVMKLKERHRKPFALTVLIDAASFNGSLPARQQGRIRSLRANGASVFLCRGDRPGYPFHKKAVVIDRRYLYSGGANVTYASEHGNGELVFRMMGPVVLETMATLAIDQARGREWL